jgi:hypothetical protein
MAELIFRIHFGSSFMMAAASCLGLQLKTSMAKSAVFSAKQTFEVYHAGNRI